MSNDGYSTLWRSRQLRDAVADGFKLMRRNRCPTSAGTETMSDGREAGNIVWIPQRDALNSLRPVALHDRGYNGVFVVSHREL